MRRVHFAAGVVLLAGLVALACQPIDEEAVSTDPVRLIDRFSPENLLHSQPVGDAEVAMHWTFDASGTVDSGTAGDWEAPVGVEDFTVDGALSGRSTTDFPILHVTFEGEVDPDDLVQALEVRLTVSAGTRFTAQVMPELPPSWDRITGEIFPWPFEVPLIADGESHAYRLSPAGMRPVAGSSVRHLILRPTDVEGAEFTVDSVRLVMRQEHLASIPSGVGWHGMESRFRESLVSRQGETLSFKVQMPQQPRFDVALATTDVDSPLFHVNVVQGEESTEVFSGRAETPHQWAPQQIDLAKYAGQEVELQLAVADEDGGPGDRLGFWGTPVVRSLGADAKSEPTPVAEEHPRGVIVMVADTLRRDHLSFYGYERDTSPTLTSLVEAGTLAEDAISQATWTKASMPAIFTGTYVSTHSVEQFTDRLPASAETMAEVFRRHGYATLGLTSIPFVGSFSNMQQGYEEFHESSSLPPNINSKGAKYYVDRLLPWLEQHKDVPFFVFLHVADPHSPYVNDSPYDTVWGEEGDREKYQELQNASRAEIDNELMRRFGMPRSQELEAAGIDAETYVGYEHDAYDGSIRGMDDQVGRLIEHLEKLGLTDDVLLAFTSDHGTEFLDHGFHFHGHTVFGELNRVPMFFWGPEYVPPGSIPARVQSVDFMPTVLELAGLGAPDAVQGQSLVPWMDDTLADGEVPSGFRSRPAITEKVPQVGGVQSHENEVHALAILDGDWKLVHYLERPEGRAEFLLFDAVNDPLDQEDLAAQHPGVVGDLADKLSAWREQALAQRLDDENLADDMSSEELERLRSLGYIQ